VEAVAGAARGRPMRHRPVAGTGRPMRHRPVAGTNPADAPPPGPVRWHEPGRCSTARAGSLARGGRCAAGRSLARTRPMLHRPVAGTNPADAPPPGRLRLRAGVRRQPDEATGEPVCGSASAAFRRPSAAFRRPSAAFRRSDQSPSERIDRRRARGGHPAVRCAGTRPNGPESMGPESTTAQRPRAADPAPPRQRPHPRAADHPRPAPPAPPDPPRPCVGAIGCYPSPR
jgi:hypothetical protein